MCDVHIRNSAAVWVHDFNVILDFTCEPNFNGVLFKIYFGFMHLIIDIFIEGSLYV